ncbi:MAG: thioredoxin family protein [Candidatus Bathyarchaeia archaeon]
MNEINVEVIGVNPPCKRCDATWRNVEKAASTLRSEGFEVSVKKLDIASKDVVKRYGALMSPAVAVNGTVKIMGRVPESDEVEKILREAAK